MFMYNIAVMGDRDSILGFQALGLHVFPTEDADEARRLLHKLSHGNYAVIYVTEQLSTLISSDIARYSGRVTPAIILIPGKSGSLGLGANALKSAVERAVGADIL